MKIKPIISCFSASVCIVITSCNTIHGLGKDLQVLGKHMAKAAPSGSHEPVSSNQATVYPVPVPQDTYYGPADAPPPR